MGWGAMFMLSSVAIPALIGLLLGFSAGLGLGGGSLLMLWLTLAIGVDQLTARAMNLMFFIATAGSVCLFRLKNHTLAIKPLLPAIAAGCIAAGIFSHLGQNLDTQLLRRIFGGLLLITGIRELFYRPRKAK